METSLARALMSDGEWAFFQRFILTVSAPNGRKPTNHRLVPDGIFRIVCPGAPWRDLPEAFGEWSSLCRHIRRWTVAGPWEQIMHALNESGAVLHALQMIDGTEGGAHHQAAGAGRGSPRQGLGRSPSGFATRIHLLVNAAGLPMRTEIPAGQGSDYPGFDPVIAETLPAPSVLLADRGQDADIIRKSNRRRAVLPVIPMRRSRRMRVGIDRSPDRRRNPVERCFNKSKNARRAATRCDRTAERFVAFVDITSIRPWLRHLAT
ncbi:IS5 family transposase [Rhodovulum sp. YEN HP10]|uniref:IS5 family transposase n=1 Tax=Rhodovulum sp. HP10 TaxID=3387397 RepID=UPI0039E05CC6